MTFEKKSYHDYVIKDGKFIGQFDEMYTAFSDPWRQSEQPNRFSRSAGITHLKEQNIRSVLECGCGLGYYADWIHQATGIVPKSVDISQVAIEKARILFPHLDFEVADIAKDLDKYTAYDCVLFSEIMWYILDDLESILQTLSSKFKGKYLLINQVFYKGTQQYGTEYFTNMNELIAYIPFMLVGHCEATLTQDSTIETAVMFKI
jgi:SAM-dependent methyltransferase